MFTNNEDVLTEFVKIPLEKDLQGNSIGRFRKLLKIIVYYIR